MPLVSIPRRRLAIPATVASRSAWSRDELAFDSQFPASNPPAATDGFNIHFVSDKEYVVYDPKSLPPGYDWTTYDPNSPPAWQLSKGAIDDDPKTIDKVLYAGVSVTIDGTPKAGDEFNVNYKPGSEKRSLLNVVSDLRKALESSTDNQAGNDAIRDATAVALTNLSAVAAAVDGGQGQDRRAPEYRGKHRDLHRRCEAGECVGDVADPGPGLTPRRCRGCRCSPPSWMPRSRAT
ncbi:flagellar hook-associated protein FlgL [Pseudomonas aeruginosa]|nr:flagellar hook-associated protein FlgL [Pseudomonas aeruginosa]